MSRLIPIVLVSGPDAGAPNAAEPAHDPAHAHDHSGELGRDVPGPAPVLLRVGDRGISEADIAQEMQHHRADNPHQSRADAARALVVRELLRLEVERLGLQAQPIEAETAEEANIRVLIEREAPTPEPDEAACRHYFESNASRMRLPDRVQARHILLAAPPSDAAERLRALQQGEQLIAELREHPERFTEYAQRHSDCPSRDQGGELGWIERGDTTPEFERQLFMLKPGMAGLTVESRWGHHVVCVDAVERGAPLSFEQAAGKIAAYLETQVKQNAIHEYLQQLQERYPVFGLDELERA